MLFAFRVDSARMVGTGHLMRCLTLASALREKGATCIFICRAHSTSLTDLVGKQGFTLYELSQGTEPLTSDCLGVAKLQDAENTKNIIQSLPEIPDWLVVDHYGIDEEWESELRPYVKKIMVIDDLANRPHNCDILLDQNPNETYENYYQNLTPPSCVRLLGLEYLMLRPEFSETARKMHHPEVATNILISIGGTDNKNVTCWILNIFRLLEIKLSIKVILGPGYSYYNEVMKILPELNLHSIIVYKSVAKISELMLEADMAIAGGGFTMYELGFIGIPTLVITYSPTQLKIAKTLHQLRMTYFAGEFENLSVTEVKKALESLLYSQAERLYISKSAQSKIKGSGVAKIIERLYEN